MRILKWVRIKSVGLPRGHRELIWDRIEVSGHKEVLALRKF